ncbi:MAG TPA: carboxypeptidase regulatory-like domain-containing protein [Thermoanaerobaculia bacterium]|jgi:outer membrane receptor protein involved in Fe transport|nr:carboxypeptidase regulatory-like domain-containing protein [Thermoanaerobaculia bacterium]
MRSTPKLRLLALALLAVACLVAPAAHAQSLTTGTITGSVSGSADAGGGVLPGASVTAVHEPTGTRYSATTGPDGRFVIVNVRSGGPYTVTASTQGYKDTSVSNVTAILGSAVEVTIEMPLAAVEETINVVANADEIINPNKTGSASAVSTATIENGATVRRQVQDFARMNPYFAVDASDAAASRITVAGRNNRYNTIQIDGAVNNDLFGLADTGTPGGTTDAQPISLDAIQQLQLVVSPYDVRQGGFTGGGINAVTRSGSNDWDGSVYGSQRDESFVGDWIRTRPTTTSPTIDTVKRPISTFSEDQYGGRLGGPIRRDNLFFFVSGERNRKDQPNGTSADGSTSTRYQGTTSPAAVANVLRSRYGYDPGSLGDIIGATDSDLAFGRLDFNAATGHQVTLRHNYVKASRDVIENRSSTSFRFPTSIYSNADKTNSTVLQVNSVFGTFFNEGRLGFQTIRDLRSVPATFPSVEVGPTAPRAGEVLAGTERFSGANSLDQDIFELTDDLTFLRGDHTVTVGTHNEAFKFKNLFLSDFYGYYYFPTQAALDAGLATQYSISFANTADPAVGFKVRQYGLYGGDQWRFNDRLTLTFGVRADKPSFVDTPAFNPVVLSALGRHTDSTPSEDVVISPRLGFNWSPTGKDQLRGGVGVFAGRTPYVWISNAFGGTGVASTALTTNCPGGTTPFTATPCIPFNANPSTQPHTGGAGSSISVDLVDPSFDFPRVLRATLGYDRVLPWDVRATIEGVWSQTQKDVFYENVGKVQTGTSPLDGRPRYSSINSTVTNAYLLTNTSKGEEKVVSLQLQRNFTRGLQASASYTWMDAKSAHDATSSRAVSNWQFRPTKGNIFDDDVARSQFEVEHRFTVAPTYTFTTGPVGHTIALFWNVQSGRPYSILMGGDVNGDGQATNDLLFVPGSADAIILQSSSGAVIPYERFAAFLRSNGLGGTDGRTLDRNEFTEPWSHQLDFHYGLEVPVKVVRAEVTFDVLNALNLINKDWGQVRFVNLQTTTPVNFVGIDSATGKPIYREAAANRLLPGSQFSTADLRSRWQAKLGLRLSF